MRLFREFCLGWVSILEIVYVRVGREEFGLLGVCGGGWGVWGGGDLKRCFFFKISSFESESSGIRKFYGRG